MSYQNNNGQNNHRRNNGGNKGGQKNDNNQLKAKELERKNKDLELKTAKVRALQKAFEEQIKSLERHKEFLDQAIPTDLVTKVTAGKTATLKPAANIIAALNGYFSHISLTVPGNDYQSIIKFLGDYQAWRDKKVAEWKEELGENIFIHATVIEEDTDASNSAGTK